ncbi:uncharacterized protein LOC131570250 [Ammospiza caudacuta]|uniref:uncharacterized protein LOC131570250 n=1 Tax=Ammospiza caudacuta TaxID=2857398 RepID=UPI002739BBE5|nr:uncharacterized protein LOC131570250 [Ammospiza caudacuta]
MLELSLNPLGMDPKSPGMESKRPNPAAFMYKGGSGKSGRPAPSRPFLRRLRLFSAPFPDLFLCWNRRWSRGSFATRASPKCPQGVPEVSPVTMEPKELSPALLQPQVRIVSTLGELWDTLPRRDEDTMLMSPVCLHWGLEEFTRELRVTLYRIHDTSWRHNVTSDDDGPAASVSRALAAYRSTPWTTWDDVKMAAGKWQRSVSVLVESWAELARKATELHSTCRGVVTWARELQDEAARDGTAQENMVGLGQALGREEGAEVVAGHEDQVRRVAVVVVSQRRRATMVRQQLEAALGLLERLVAACDEATAFPRELQWRLRDIEAALEVTNWVSADVPESLVAKVAAAEQLWVANARLAKDHVLGAIDDIIDYYSTGGPTGPSACGVAERCQRAIEDIPRLLQPPECPRSIPKISPVSPQQLQALVAVVATLGMVAAAVMAPHWDKSLNSHEDLRRFTRSLHATLNLVMSPSGATLVSHPWATLVSPPLW